MPNQARLCLSGLLGLEDAGGRRYPSSILISCLLLKLAHRNDACFLAMGFVELTVLNFVRSPFFVDYAF